MDKGLTRVLLLVLITTEVISQGDDSSKNATLKDYRTESALVDIVYNKTDLSKEYGKYDEKVSSVAEEKETPSHGTYEEIEEPLPPVINVTIVAVYNNSLGIVQLNISWETPFESCDPLYYDFVVLALSEDKHCSPHNHFESSSDTGDITNIALPQFVQHSEVEPGCMYSIEVVAHCSNEEVYKGKQLYTVPECVGQKCNCASLGPEIESFNVTQVFPEHLNISWKMKEGDDYREINNIQNITLELSFSEEHMRHYQPFEAWLLLTKGNSTLANQSFVLTPTSNFKSGYMYDIKANFENKFACIVHRLSNITVNQAVPSLSHHPKHLWYKILIILSILSIICASLLLYVRPSLRRFKKMFGSNTTPYASIMTPQIRLELNPLYQHHFEKQLDNYEFPRQNLQPIKFLASGVFGEVRLGKALNIAGKPGWTYVAYKQPKENIPKQDMKDFLHEINVLKKIGYHPHVVSMLGCCTLEFPFLMLMEYVPCGSLKDYLEELREKWKFYRKRKQTECDSVFNEGSESSYIVPDSPNSVTTTGTRSVQLPSLTETEYTNLSSEGTHSASPSIPFNRYSMEYLLDNEELKQFSLQIAKGMAHLENIGITHRDLAARNVLMDEFKTLKITDFGLSRYGTYIVEKKVVLPIRWMAIESIRDHKFDNKSDVWSYGVVLWEIGTLGAFPYKEVPDHSIVDYITKGKKLSRPEICTDELYSLMQRCWSNDPEERPSFEEVVGILSKEDSKAYINFSHLNPSYVFPPKEEDGCISDKSPQYCNVCQKSNDEKKFRLLINEGNTYNVL